MRWLRDRIRGRRGNPPPKPAGEPPVPEPPAPEPAIPNFDRPRLVLLVHDAAGPATYQLHSFEDEAEAAAFVQFWFPGDIDHGVIAFWASHREPEVEAGERPAEVVVLIRGDNRPKTVYPFSFAGMDLARSWLTRESNRDLDPDQMLMYWAVPARISRDHWGRVHVWPSEPPALRRERRSGSQPKPPVQRQPQSPPRFEPWLPERKKQHPQQPLELQASQPPAETPAVEASQPSAETPAETLPPAAGEPALVDEPLEPPAETPVEASTVIVDEPLELPAEAPPEEPPGLPFEAPTVFEEPAEERAASTLPPAGEKPAPPAKAKPRRKGLPLDPQDEPERLLGPSRWEQREGPFKGFGSPPGKF